jgi:phage tail-like protein
MTEQTKSNYLKYLPAVFQQHPFLGEFLLPFEQVHAGLGDLLSTIDRYFAPALADAEFLPWLATWVALILDEDWDEAKRRQLISEAVTIYRERGTVKGLKRYLEIYTELEPDIRECLWPGGMQIGVASQIGGIEPADAPLTFIESVTPCETHTYDYYVVDTVDAEGNPEQIYYRADRVLEVEVGDGSVDVHYYPPDSSAATHRPHEPATVTRRDGLVDERYVLDTGGEDKVVYQGNTFLVDEVERAYCFIVDVRAPRQEIEESRVKLDKVRAIVDLEKPAHTIYYLKLTPVVSEYLLQPMQIEVRSTIGVDTIIG